MVERITIETSDEALLTMFSPAQIARFRARGALPPVASSSVPTLSATTTTTNPSRTRRPPMASSPRIMTTPSSPEPLPSQYKLTCGALLPPSIYIPPPRSESIFPVIDRPHSHPQTSHALKTNGCGAVIHEAALPYTLGVWMAKGKAQEVVDELSYDYFDDTQGLAEEGTLHCGCRSSGVGCIECGNTLGSRTILCPPHTARLEATILYRFLPSNVMTSLEFEFSSAALPTPLGLNPVSPVSLSPSRPFVGTPSAQALAQADEYKPDEGEAHL